MKTGHARRLYLGTVISLAVIAGLLVAARIAIPAAAITTLSQGFLTTDAVSLGSIVSLKSNSSDQVEAATISNVDGLLGVVITNDSSLLSVTDNQAKQIQVATSGVAQVLVADINGSINAGDSITASPIKGVGMKATNSVKVIGISQGKLDNGHASKTTYKDKNGQQHDVVLSQIPVLVNVSYFYKQPDKTLIPPAIQNIANALAGKTVKPLPIIISAGIFLVALIVVVSIIYAMIRSSIISVGRNPMAQSAVYRNVIMLSMLVLIILGVSVTAIYLILAKF